MRLVRWLLAPLRPRLPGRLVRWVYWRRVTFTYDAEDVARAVAWYKEQERQIRDLAPRVPGDTQ